MYIKKETLTIIGLCLSAALLLLVNFPTAQAENTLKDRDYQLITSRASQGGESLYIMDNRTGLIGVFIYDPNSHRMVLRSSTSVPAIFGAH
jgi:hypothetical protein